MKYTRLVDYFIVIGVDPHSSGFDINNASPQILDRFPLEDYKNCEFPSGVAVCCCPLGFEILHKEEKQRKPFISSFCLTNGNGEKSYATFLQYYEPILKGDELEGPNTHYFPKSLCIMSHFPFFTFFSQFLREIYRSFIQNQDESNDFLFNLRRSSVNISNADLLHHVPVECYIARLINDIPKIEPSIRINFNFGSRNIQVICPPSSLPWVDDDCYTVLFTCLSPNTILQIIRFLLLEQKIILLTTRLDILTPICEGILSLLNPFYWVFTYIPLLPLQLIDYLEAPTPYLIGLHTQAGSNQLVKQLRKSQIFVDLDYDRIDVPTNLDKRYEKLPSNLVNNLAKLLQDLVPKPSVRILFSDDSSKYMEYEVTFGVGNLGIEFAIQKIPLVENGPKYRVLIVEGFKNLPNGQLSPAAKCGAITIGSYLVSLNDSSIAETPLKTFVHLLDGGPRPIVCKFQTGVKPHHLIFSSGDQQLEELSDSAVPLHTEPLRGAKNYSTNQDVHKPRIPEIPANESLDTLPVLDIKVNKVKDVASPDPDDIASHSLPKLNVDEEKSSKSRPKHRRNKSEIVLSTDTFYWVEDTRCFFLDFMVQLINVFDTYVDLSHIKTFNVALDKKHFLKECKYQTKQFLTQFVDTQIFSFFIDEYVEMENPIIKTFARYSQLYNSNKSNLLKSLFSKKQWELKDLEVQELPPDSFDGYDFSDRMSTFFFPRFYSQYFIYSHKQDEEVPKERIMSRTTRVESIDVSKKIVRKEIGYDRTTLLSRQRVQTLIDSGDVSADVEELPSSDKGKSEQSSSPINTSIPPEKKSVVTNIMNQDSPDPLQKATGWIKSFGKKVSKSFKDKF